MDPMETEYWSQEETTAQQGSSSQQQPQTPKFQKIRDVYAQLSDMLVPPSNIPSTLQPPQERYVDTADPAAWPPILDLAALERRGYNKDNQATIPWSNAIASPIRPTTYHEASAEEFDDATGLTARARHPGPSHPARPQQQTTASCMTFSRSQRQQATAASATPLSRPESTVPRRQCRTEQPATTTSVRPAKRTHTAMETGDPSLFIDLHRNAAPTAGLYYSQLRISPWQGLQEIAQEAQRRARQPTAPTAYIDLRLGQVPYPGQDALRTLCGGRISDIHVNRRGFNQYIKLRAYNVPHILGLLSVSPTFFRDKTGFRNMLIERA